MDYTSYSIIEGDLTKDTLGQLYTLPAQRAQVDADAGLAEARVNSYVAKRYTTQVTDATAILILRDLTLALFGEIAWGRAAGETLPEKVIARADKARDMLKDIATGKMTLAGATAVEEATESGSEGIVVEVDEPIFNRSNMGGY